MIVYQGCTEEEWSKAVAENAGLKEWGDGPVQLRRIDVFGEAEQIWVEQDKV